MLEPETLLSLRERIASLEVLPCRLAHEQVVLQGGLAQRRSQGMGLEPALVRTGLCPGSLRARQLSCAHTSARDVLMRAIETMGKESLLAEGDAERLTADLRRISDSIHETDWNKNASEARYALLLEQGPHEGPALLDEKRRLAELVSRHQAASEELSRMHGMLLECLDRALARLTSSR